MLMSNIRVSAFQGFIIVVGMMFISAGVLFSEPLYEAQEQLLPQLPYKLPRIVTRAQWGAMEPLFPMMLNTPKYITIHHTGEVSNSMLPVENKMRSLQSFSQRETILANGAQKPAWADVPYHFYIDICGVIALGREIKYVGDTNTDYDPAGHVLIVLEGNFEQEIPDYRQLFSLELLCWWLSGNYDIDSELIRAHKDYSKTACPGLNLYKLLPYIRNRIGDLSQGEPVDMGNSEAN